MDSVKDDDDQLVLPGFRFHPTDEELVSFYLQRKVDKKLMSIEFIRQTDIYKYDPWDLAKKSSNVADKEWYYFCKRERKYRNSTRPNRVTESGFWKATGIDKQIYSAVGGSHDCIGLKKSLVYYLGSAGKGTKTDWMMHEFRLPTDQKHNQEAEIWTLCRIFKRDVSSRKCSPDRREVPAKENLGDAVTLDAERMEERRRSHVGSEAESSSSTILSDEARELVAHGNWDEMVSALEFSFDPYHL